MQAVSKIMFSQDFAGRCLPFDAASVDNYAAIVSGRLSAGQAIPTEDAMIAAIAMTHGYTFATRNIKDFSNIGLKLYDPWQN